MREENRESGWVGEGVLKKRGKMGFVRWKGAARRASIAKPLRETS